MRIHPLAERPGVGPLMDAETGPAAGALARRPEGPESVGPAAVGSAGDRIGARLGRARAAQKLTVEEVSSRTYIRPSVLRRMEKDDFTACGGDCYARGQLRMLAGALHVDEGEFLVAYEQQEGTHEPDLVPDDGTAREHPRRGIPVAAGVWLGLLMLAVLAGLLTARIVS